MQKSLCELLPLGRTMAILTKSYYGALTKRLGHMEIDRHYSILILIESIPGGCTQQYICQQLKIDKVSMVRMIHYLIEKHYLNKVVNEQDKREYLLQLTRKSKAALPEIHNAVKEVNEAALAGLSSAERKKMYECLTAIQSNLDNLPTDKIYINYKKSTVKK